MTVRTVAQKMGIKPGWRAHFVEPPAGVMAEMDLPDLVVDYTLDGEFDYLHLFVVTQGQMRSTFPELVHHVAPHGKLWVSWPKSRKLGSDLSLPKVIEIGYNFGLVESTCLRPLQRRTSSSCSASPAPHQVGRTLCMPVADHVVRHPARHDGPPSR